MIKKKTIIALSLSILSFGLIAQDLPQPSPFASVMQRVGLTDVTLEYSRPGVKDRTIFGGLEAYGEVWRTGANSATKITLSTDATIGGAALEAGTYSILSIPGESEWKIMFNSDLNVQEGSYDEEKNIAVITVKSDDCENRESLLFYFDQVKNASAVLVFEWEKTRLSIPVEVKSREMAMENIKKELDAIEQPFRAYNSSARYYLSENIELEKALEWSKKSVAANEKFWNVYTLSLIYEAMDNKKMAIETAKKSMQLSEEAKYMPYVKMNKENIEKWSK